MGYSKLSFVLSLSWKITLHASLNHTYCTTAAPTRRTRLYGTDTTPPGTVTATDRGPWYKDAAKFDTLIKIVDTYQIYVYTCMYSTYTCKYCMLAGCRYCQSTGVLLPAATSYVYIKRWFTQRFWEKTGQKKPFSSREKCLWARTKKGISDEKKTVRFARARLLHGFLWVQNRWW